MKTITKKLIITAIVGILALTIGAEISLAATATFTGSIDDDGGDPNLLVWFQYGKTTSYGSETSHQSKYGTGEFTATVSGLENCTTYHYRAASKHQNFDDTMYGQDKTFTTLCDNSPTVDIKANNSDGPITIAYNYAATLTWTSQNANSCTAAGAWSGAKLTSGSESTGNLTFGSRIYTITCTGPGGSASDSVTINVQQVLGTVSPTIQKKARNLSDGQSYFSDSVIADPGEVLEFHIQINSGSEAQNAAVKDILPDRISVRANSLKVDGMAVSGDIISGISLGNLAQNQTKIITFWADVAPADKFLFGQTNLTNTATIYWNGNSLSDSASIVVSKKAVLGATSAPTGLTNNIFFDSLILPLLAALTLTWLFKSHILKWEEWMDERKKEYRKFKTEKLLRLKIAEIKAREFFKL